MNFKFIILITIITFMTISTFAQEQAIVLKTQTGDINGVLIKPVSSKKIPVVLLISGSGPTDKDGNQPTIQNNSLKLLAEALQSKGIASVRFDKRGIASSQAAGTKEEDIRFENYIDDVTGWINLLAQDKDFSKIIVAGHSEGSLIGMAACAKSEKVGKFISIAGAGMPADEILKEQSKAQPHNVKDIIFPILDTLKRGETISDVPPPLAAFFRPSVQPYLISWFKYNPQEEIKKLKIPVLIIQGDKDIQVSVKDAELLAAGSKTAEKKIIANMNHVLKTIDTTDQTEQLKTYSDPALPLNSEMVKDIVEFIQN